MQATLQCQDTIIWMYTYIYIYIYVYILPLLPLYRGYNSLEMAKQQPICTAAVADSTWIFLGVFFSIMSGEVSFGWKVVGFLELLNITFSKVPSGKHTNNY